MAEFPALHLWTDAYLADTTHLTTLENGAYLLLLMAAWRSPCCRLPNDDKLLARFARLTPGQWKRIKPTIMAFWTIESDHIYQGRLTDEYNAVRQLSTRQSDKAKARWLKNKDTVNATASPGICPSDASPYPYPSLTHTQKEKKERDPPAGPPKGDARSKRRTGKLLPEDWKPNEDEIRYARERGFTEAHIRDIADDFRTYWTAGKGRNTTHADWRRCWQGWVRRETPRRADQSGNGAGHSQRRNDGGLASAIRRNLV